jgi:hypothetical protein
MAAHEVQRERFRESLRDALDGVDVAALQSDRPSVPATATAPLWSPTRPTVRVTPAPAAVPVPAIAPVPAVDRVRAEVEALMAPLSAEVAALRAELSRVARAPEQSGRERRADMLTLGALLVAMLFAGVVLTLLLHR